ncbi:MAG: DUF2125 domain-containing protein [Nioella sp.]
MKTLLRMIAALAVLVSLWWLAGSVVVPRLITGWLDQRAAAGWEVDHGRVETTGFPTRFETTLHGLTLADPFTGWAVRADRFDLHQASHRPQAIRAIWPEEHVFATPGERLTIRAGRLETLLHVRPLDNLALQRAETEMRALQIDSDLGWTGRLAEAEARIARREEAAPRYDITFDARGLVPADEVLRLIDPAATLPGAIEHLHVDGVAGFDRAWDLDALERARPAITRIELVRLRVDWGDLALEMSGDLDVDAAGLPTGELAVQARNWRRMLMLGAEAGALPAALRRTLDSGLGVLAGLSGRPENLDTTLRFAAGQVYLGPVPLGPAPRLVLR